MKLDGGIYLFVVEYIYLKLDDVIYLNLDIIVMETFVGDQA